MPVSWMNLLGALTDVAISQALSMVSLSSVSSPLMAWQCGMLNLVLVKDKFGFLGLCFSLQSVSWCKIFRYSSVLMAKELISFLSVIRCFMVLIITAFAVAEALALFPDIIQGNQMVESIFELMDRSSGVVSNTGVDAGNISGMVELKGVEFCYPSRPGDMIFRDLDLTVNSGKTMALVGMSGSGKSTVLSLILRFYDPTAGKVMIDGMPWC